MKYTKEQALGALKAAASAGDNKSANQWASYLDSMKVSPAVVPVANTMTQEPKEVKLQQEVETEQPARFKHGGTGIYEGVLTGAIMRMGGQGLTLGAGDEINAGIYAGWEKLIGDNRPYGEIYDEILVDERRRLSEIREDYPALALGSEIVGSVAGPVAALASTIKIAKLGVTGNVAVQAGAVGVPYAYLSSDGTVTDRVDDAVTAAVTAPLFGVVGQKMMNFSLPVVKKVWGGVTKGTKPLPKTTEGLREAKNNAYQLVSDNGVRFSGGSVNNTFKEFTELITEKGNYQGVEDKVATQVINMYKGLIPKEGGKGIELKDIDKMQQNMWTRYSGRSTTGAEKTVILDAINSLDDLLIKHVDTSEVMSAARLANKQFKKAQTFDRVKTEIDIDVKASDANIDQLARYKKAVAKIMKDPKQIRYYEESEIEVLNEFLKNTGTLTNKFLGTVGKFSPSGQFMAMVHGAAAWNTGGLSAVGTSALYAAKKSGAKGRNKLGPEVVEAMKGNTKEIINPSRVATIGAGTYGRGMLTDSLNNSDRETDAKIRRAAR